MPKRIKRFRLSLLEPLVRSLLYGTVTDLRDTMSPNIKLDSGPASRMFRNVETGLITDFYFAMWKRV